MADPSAHPGMNAYRLRVVIAARSARWSGGGCSGRSTRTRGCTPLRRPPSGWNGEHLPRPVTGGAEYGIGYAGGPGFRDDARQVSLAGPGLREGERFACGNNFSG